MNKRLIKWGIRLSIFFVILLMLLFLAWLFPHYDHVVLLIGRIFLPFVLSIVLAMLLHPLVHNLEELGLSRILSILLIFLAFFLLIGYGVYKGYPHLVQQIKLLNEQLPHLIEAYERWTKEMYEQTERFPDGIHDRLEESFAKLEAWMDARLMSIITGMSGLFNVIILIAVIPVMTFYFLKDHHYIMNAMLCLIPRKWKREAVHLTKKLNQSLGGYIRGQLLISLFVGVLATLGFWAAGLPYPLVLGVIAGITNIIPYFGPLIGAVPALIVAVTLSVKALIITVAAIVIIQMIEGNLLSPYIMGKSIHTHPLLIIFALLAGGELAGIAGMVLAVPVLTCLKVILEEFYQARLNVDR
ncbi:AI-2E family transporter [Halobacillus sp. A5]|uniref:AI-2E family transporter n=1 Tax=Halobacillus sp. A5 TaxID=2880263 RepID=UPI0020A6CAE0|nr:AI-2E family transporter [Halobacillus sp. A5]MCP3025586.1 AI-2E family transporter [Halobacillus sp. A5]